MARRVRVFRGVSIRRTIATPRPATLLARPQVHPRRTNLHALFADAFLGMFEFGDGVDMNAGFWCHARPPGSSITVARKYRTFVTGDTRQAELEAQIAARKHKLSQ